MLDNRQYSYNFDCNKVIESTKFKNSVTLYDRVNTQNVMTNAVVNLMPHMIQMEYDLLKYIHDNFMVRCELADNTHFLNTVRKCPVDSLTGFP